MAKGSGNLVSSKEAQARVMMDGLISRNLRLAKEGEARKRQESEEFREIKELYKARARKQLARARRGLARLIALGRSQTMNKFFLARQRRIDACARSRSKDENWFCFSESFSDMQFIHIHIYPDKIGIVFGPEAPNPPDICFPYDNSSDRERMLKEMIYCAERKKILIKKEMLKEDKGRGWVPVIIASQILVNCGDRKKFEGYLTHALKENR